MTWFGMSSRDWRYAMRHLAANRGISTAAVLSLATGMGASTTTYTWVDHMLLRPLPGVQDSGRLRVLLSRSPAGTPGSVSAPDFDDLRRDLASVADVAATGFSPVTLTTNAASPPDRVFAEFVSENYFTLLDPPISLGRTFSQAEATRPGSEPVAVLSHSLWLRRFGGDRSVVGTAVLLNNQPFTVVGIAGPEFLGGFVAAGTDLWVPLSMQRQLMAGNLLDARGARWLQGLVRPLADAPSGQLGVRLDAASRRLASEYAAVDRGRTFFATPLWRSPAGAQAALRPVLFSLLALATLLLALAIANVANLLFAELLQRRGELSLRIALGAGRPAAIAPALAEALLLSLMAGAGGLALSYGALPLLRVFQPPAPFPIHFETGVNRLTLELLCALIFIVAGCVGLVPGLLALRGPIANVLRTESGTLTGASPHRRVSDVLAMLQIATCAAVLVGAGLSLRSLGRTSQTPLGFDPSGVLVGTYDLSPLHYADATGIEVQKHILDLIAADPEISSVSTGSTVPFAMGGHTMVPLSVDGYEARPGEDMTASLNVVGPWYFRTMRIALTAGRELDERDNGRAPRVAVVNEAFAKRYWGNGPAVGRHIRVFGASTEIVGVAANVRYETVNEEPPPALYLAAEQRYTPITTLHIRSDHASAGIGSVRRSLGEFGPTLPLFNVTPLANQIRAASFAQRFAASISLTLATACVLLTAVGIFSLLACAIAVRKSEIAVRVALGARPSDVLRMVCRHAARVTVAGMALSVPAAWASARLLNATLVGITVTDPMSWAAAFGLIVLIAGVATAVAGARAVRISPADALRRLAS